MRSFALSVFIFLFACMSAQIVPITGNFSQTFYCPAAITDTVDKIFIHGRVTKQGDSKTGISKATVQVKNTDLLVASDSLGYYWLDISEISDATKNYSFQCNFVNHETKEINIAQRIEKTTVINFELLQNGGIVAPQKAETKPVKKKKRRKQK